MYEVPRIITSISNTRICESYTRNFLDINRPEFVWANFQLQTTKTALLTFLLKNIRVKDNIIVDIKVETFGCVAAIATSSMTTQMAKGKTLE